MDLVGIEPTTSPAMPGRAQPFWHFGLILESSGETSNSSVAAHAPELLTEIPILPDKPIAMVPGRGLTWSAPGYVQLILRPDLRHNRCKIGQTPDSAECIRKALRGHLKDGGPGRDRTDDLFHAMEARSQLRHRPTGKIRNRFPTLNSRPAFPRRQTQLGYGD